MMTKIIVFKEFLWWVVFPTLTITSCWMMFIFFILNRLPDGLMVRHLPLKQDNIGSSPVPADGDKYDA